MPQNFDFRLLVAGLFETSGRAYISFSRLNSLFGDKALSSTELESGIAKLGPDLISHAAAYEEAARGLSNFVGDPDVRQAVLVRHLDQATAGPAELAQMRNDLIAGARQARACVMEARRLVIAGQSAPWPAEPPELWSDPLQLPVDVLSSAGASTIQAARKDHQILSDTLKQLARSGFAESELRDRRSNFIAAAKATILRSRWEVLASRCRGRETDLLSALQSGQLKILAIGPK